MVAVRFREPPMQLFQGTGAANVHPNWLLIGIQPDDVVQMATASGSPDEVKAKVREYIASGATAQAGHQEQSNQRNNPSPPVEHRNLPSN